MLSTTESPSDFPETRAAIVTIPNWVDVFASRLPTPIQITQPTGGFRWEHPSYDAEALQVAKAVRIASGLRGALALADIGHTVECYVLLRTVSDFAEEIMFITEGFIEGRFTSEQKQFINQHFSPTPRTFEDLVSREREYYIGRRAIAKAQERLAEKLGTPKKLIADLRTILNKGYDSYVHGAHHTAMELFTGRNMSFMMKGTEAPRQVFVAKTCVAGKVNEALNSFKFMALTRGLEELGIEIDNVYQRIENSGEDAGEPR
jgi:hypothetical protein